MKSHEKLSQVMRSHSGRNPTVFGKKPHISRTTHDHTLDPAHKRCPVRLTPGNFPGITLMLPTSKSTGPKAQAHREKRRSVSAPHARRAPQSGQAATQRGSGSGDGGADLDAGAAPHAQEVVGGTPAHGGGGVKERDMRSLCPNP